MASDVLGIPANRMAADTLCRDNLLFELELEAVQAGGETGTAIG